ncbi:MarR family winged helix-turn-helix transcriptional regulator [Lacticaseibacillus thailandensis]|nr:MarR family winged helix-turn-helix transcriptional regulator [Lacticaseibacillus thailandensis]
MNTDQAMTAFIDSYFHAVKGFTAALQAAVSPYKISFEQYQIMRDIATGRIETLTDIVKLRGVTKPAIARQIGSLLRLGYVQQKTAQADHRRRLLALTHTGANVEQTITTSARRRFQAITRHMGATPLAELTTLLGQLNAALEATASA